MTHTIPPNTYLTESLLGQILAHRFGESEILSQYKIGPRFKCDYLIKSLDTIVEFDGDAHYCNVTQQRRDHDKDVLIHKAGMRLVRIPYFVQLTPVTFQHYFNVDADVSTTFPHGFVSTNCVLPGNFNTIGTDLFIAQLRALPLEVRDAIHISIMKKIGTGDPKWVYGTGAILDWFLKLKT